MNVNYSSVPTQLNYKKITLMVNVGTCSSVAVTADGASVPATYISSSGTALFTTTGSNINVTAVNWTAGGTGTATKATLYNNYHWAYSLTFDDNRQSQYDYGVTLLQQHNWRAAEAVVSTWANGGGPGQYFMNWTELQTLRNTYGWDMMNHSNDHPNPLTCNGSATAIVTEVTQNQNTLLTKFPGYYVNQMVFPYENSTANTCSGYPTSFLLSAECGGGSFNYVDVALPFQFQRGGLFGTDDTAWKALADSAAANSRPTWLVEYTHSVSSGSSAAADTYSTNQATLGDLLNHLDSTYGAAGNKSLWFAPAPEVRDYIFVRDNAVVTTCTVVTPTPSSTATATKTNTPMPPTATPTASPTPSPTRTNTPNPPTNTFTPTATSTRSATPTSTYSSTPSATPTATSTATPSSTATKTNSPTASPTSTGTATFTASSSSTATSTHSATLTATRTFTTTFSNTATGTSTPSSTSSATPTFTNTPSSTFSPTFTKTSTPTNSFTSIFSNTATSTFSPTKTVTPTVTLTPTDTAIITPTPTSAGTSTFTVTNTSTSTPTNTWSPTSTRTATRTNTSTGTSTFTSTSTDSFTFTATVTSTPTVTMSPTNPAVITPTATSSFTKTDTPVNTPSSTPTFTNTATSTATATFTNTQTFTSTNTFTGTPTFTFTPTHTSTFTLSPTPTSSKTSTPVGNTGVIVFPNPDAGTSVNILPPGYTGVEDVRFVIFTASFRKVLDVHQTLPGGTPATVELKDAWGHPLADGLYYVFVFIDGKRSFAKLLVLH